MKRIFLTTIVIFCAQLGFSQILFDSLIVEEPILEDLNLNEIQADTLQEVIPLREISTSGDTVFIKEIVYDTIYMSTPLETIEPLETVDENLEIEDNNDDDLQYSQIQYTKKHWKGSNSSIKPCQVNQDTMEGLVPSVSDQQNSGIKRLYWQD